MKHLLYPILLAVVIAVVYSLLPISVRSKVCTFSLCMPPIIRCIIEPECKTMLDCLESCDDEHSEKRRQAQAKYQHLQFPQNRALCDYECLELITSQTGEDLVECIGSRGCMVPSDYSDECADI